MSMRIAMWSGPRNISTAMMRSWENRADTQVVDEPFYAFYLQQTQSPHPCFDEILATQSSNYEQVTGELCNAACNSPLQYQKHMTHHMLEGVDMGWTRALTHCFLIRDPAQVVNSYTNSRGVCCAEDIGIIRQAELYKEISQLTGQDIPIIDSNDVLQNPKGVLSKLCQRLQIPFDEAMLAWPAGKRSSDGVWASHWYHSVEKSSGFAQAISKAFVLSEAQQQVVDEVSPHFEYLYDKRIRVQ
jgi:hypothetical protein